VKRTSYSQMNCSVARTLDVVGDPWTLLIVRDVFWGHHRFNELQERLGIARNTLADRLAVLVDADTGTPLSELGIRSIHVDDATGPGVAQSPSNAASSSSMADGVIDV